MNSLTLISFVAFTAVVGVITYFRTRGDNNYY
jgi:uncharacterized sodium:solute symporter family permease YidK